MRKFCKSVNENSRDQKPVAKIGINNVPYKSFLTKEIDNSNPGRSQINIKIFIEVEG